VGVVSSEMLLWTSYNANLNAGSLLKSEIFVVL